MTDPIVTHYGGTDDLAAAIRQRLDAAGKDLDRLTTADLAPVDEFHIRGRAATLEAARGMGLTPESHVLDLGSGLGGPARTVAETHRCRVTGIDLTPAFCATATRLSAWVGLADRVDFEVGDATALPLADGSFDAAMTLHVAMNIKAKDRLYAEARRVLRPGGHFAAYDVLQGEGGPVLFPVPWARDARISYLATPEAMPALLEGAGFEVIESEDSTEGGHAFFVAVTEWIATSGLPPLGFHAFLGDDFQRMAANMRRNLAERRVRTIRYLCRA